MIDVPLIDELRDIRRRLAEQCQENIELYTQMLEEVSRRLPGTYVTKPFTPTLQPPAKELEPARQE